MSTKTKSHLPILETMTTGFDAEANVNVASYGTVDIAAGQTAVYGLVGVNAGPFYNASVSTNNGIITLVSTGWNSNINGSGQAAYVVSIKNDSPSAAVEVAISLMTVGN